MSGDLKMVQILRCLRLGARFTVRGGRSRDLLSQSRAPTTSTQNLSLRATVSTRAETEAYGAGQIQVLEGLEPVRKRPGMYIGSTGQRGLHHLFFEVLDNAMDEVQAGFATDVHILLNAGSELVCVRDNGRGIPTEKHPQTGKSALETVMTVLHAGGKFGGEKSGYLISGGLHGVGVSVVNALSEWLEVTVWRNGKEHVQCFSRGVPTSKMKVKKIDPDKTGTQVQFKYDPMIFSEDANFDPKALILRLRELAFLNSNASIHYKMEEETIESEWTTFNFSGGLKEYVKHLNRDKTALHDVIVFEGEKSGVQVAVGLQWCSDSFSDSILGFANNIKTIDGGTHLDGLKTALTRTINSLSRKHKLLKETDPNIGGDFVREGLGGVLSVKVPDPEFEGQTKTRLGNPEVRRIVDNFVSQEVAYALELDPDSLQKIATKGLEAFKAAEAAKKARDLVRRKSVLANSTLPGKLADCSHEKGYQSEIFIVEGESAGGSAKQARDRKFQAILPLRGKILNAERCNDESLYKNSEITSMIVALGLGNKGSEDLSGLRYDKIVILTDADVDGAHIRTLLLTFLFRFQRRLFEEGKVFAAVPPLYKVRKNREEVYCYNEKDLQDVTGGSHRSLTIQRFKGLGEMMPLQLWDTTLNPETRTLRRLTIEDVVEVSHTFSVLMGDKVETRKMLIEEESKKMDISDLDI